MASKRRHYAVERQLVQTYKGGEVRLVVSG